MNTRANKKAVRRMAVLLLIALVCIGIGTAAIHSANNSMQRISASTFAFQDFSDTQDISLGVLREGQVIAYESVVEQGNVELWIENSAGEQLPGRDGLEGVHTDCPEDGEYFIVITGSDAAFSVGVSVSIFDVH